MKEVAAPASLAAKLLEVAKSIGGVEKDARNEHHGYDYASAEAVIRKVRESLFERGVIVVPGVDHGGLGGSPGVTRDQGITTVPLRYRFIDTETGEELMIPWVAQGFDKGDKGAFKAFTGGLKYVLLGVFLIPFGDDPEADAGTDKAVEQRDERAAAPRIPRDRAQAIVARAKQAGVGEGTFMAKVYDLGASKIVELNVDQAEALEAFIDGEAEGGDDAV